MNKSILKIWFGNGRIWIKTTDSDERSQLLEVFPSLFYATEEQRMDYYLWDENRSIRWEKLDEDIHISNFYEEETVNYDNEVNDILSKFPFIDLKVLAEYLDMHWTKLVRYRFGVYPASNEIVNKIKKTLKALGKEMSAAML